jgi:hypothetical protein
MSGRRACKRVKRFGLDLTVPRVLSATRKEMRLHRLVTGSRLGWRQNPGCLRVYRYPCGETSSKPTSDPRRRESVLPGQTTTALMKATEVMILRV